MRSLSFLRHRSCNAPWRLRRGRKALALVIAFFSPVLLDSCSDALVIAAEYSKNPRVISLLLKAGADVDAVDNSGRTALMVATQFNRDPKIISALRAEGAR